MPKFFCDYCDVYLTHDSMSVRKAHNSGRNHLRNVVDYYQQIGHEKAQSVIDSITSSYAAEGQAHANPMLPHNQPGGGSAFGLGPSGMSSIPPPMPGMPPLPGMPAGAPPTFPFPPPPFPGAAPPGGPASPAGGAPPFPLPGFPAPPGGAAGRGGAPPPFPGAFPPPGAPGGLPFPPPPGGGAFPAFPPPPGGFPGEKR
ncbi:zf-U1-domain-containing protein [Parathielavia appendiculata]|uniref:U1 small nuclear ribonucleoprotein C n=1 Tax=Parathielavia appendiculata TaxID=2587402 RepID=A0AAN6TUL6_9PEZI|nr:zf-U1-domain-containing protein [Parathielavia appendiculata]